MSATSEVTSRYGFAETVARLTATIADSGSTLFATIDQSAAAHAVRLELRPTTLIVFGNPRAGTGLMDAFPRAALALPLRLLVWEDAGVTRVTYAHMRELLEATGVPGDDPHIAALDGALAALSASVTEAAPAR
jgi:uncharacterized protein (DUF302 family)